MMKQRIEHYTFGRMTAGGNDFTSDVIIYPDGRIQENWQRQSGHKLVPEDIVALLDSVPQKLIIGTGNSGLMVVSSRVAEQCQKLGIKVEVFPTTIAVQRFNKAAQQNALVAACFHLTC